tara:strand:+ start:12797 stop:13906 length:1110 start_codon:yes stop_codon:yes gene_type:complete
MKWKVPYVNLPTQFENLEGEITKEIIRVMSKGEFILKDDVKKFEDKMASYLGVKHVIGVNSGTDALNLSTKLIGLKKGDEVITVAHTFVATIAAIVHTGAKPVFVDIKDDFNMDIGQIENKITDKTKAIIPVHLNGRVCDMGNLEEITKKHNLKIIEDSAQSLGSKYNGRMAGSFGLTGCFSFHPMKTLNCAGDGGAITTNDDNIAKKAKLLRNHGQREKTDIVFFGYNTRLDNLQAAILNIKFKYLKRDIKRRREIASIYSEKLSGLDLILPPKPSKGDNFDTYNSYVIRSSKQQELFSYMKKKGIETFIHMSKPLYNHKRLYLSNSYLPVNEKICKEILSLPICPELTNKQINYVVDSLHKFFKDKR